MNIDEAIQLALKYYQTGNLKQAELTYREILTKESNNAIAYNDLGLVLRAKGDIVEATTCFKKAIQINPNFYDSYFHLGHILQTKGQLDEAIQYYQKAIEINPSFAEAYNNLGNILKYKGQLDEAIQCYQKAIQVNPSFTEAYNNLGNALKDKGQLDGAITYYQKAIQINPSFAGIYNNLGNAFRGKNQLDKAITYYQKAIEINPNYAEAHWNMSHAFLLSGNFKQGWEEYEWRLKISHFPYQRNFSQSNWNRPDIKGLTILLHTEQGLGDAIQFIRYAPLVADCGAKVIVGCQKELTSLFQKVEGIQQIVACGEQLPLFDIHCPLLSLPLKFDTSVDTIPAQIPYIEVDVALLQKWKDKVNDVTSQFRVGLSWAGSPKNPNDRYRSFPLETFAPLAQLNGVIFYSLQKGKGSEQARDTPEGMRLVDYTDEIQDFSDTAALIETLDLVISVDTAVVHLAGAMGKTVWTLLPFVPDWRWMLNREDSPWYPTMRLFRQPAPGDWELTISKVKDELLKLLDEK